MTKRILLSLSFALATLFTGCAHMPTATRSVALSPTASTEAVLEAAVDAAREAGLPAVSKMDKANGVVEFGAFGMPELGVTGQVMVRSGHVADLTVKRGSVYIPLKADEQADKFRAAFEERLRALNLGGKP